MITLRFRKQGYSREARGSVTNRDIWGYLPAMLARNASVGSRRAENVGCDSVEQIGPGTKYVDGKGIAPKAIRQDEDEDIWRVHGQLRGKSYWHQRFCNGERSRIVGDG